jgi:hypothetical protein
LGRVYVALQLKALSDLLNFSCVLLDKTPAADPMLRSERRSLLA